MRKYWSLEDTLSGYLLDELLFCSRSNLNYFSNTSCPIQCVSRSNPFWNAASIGFARQASGYVVSVLNGSRTNGAMANTSTFYKYELPELNSNRVTHVKVLLLHTPDEPKYETCKKPKSLAQLEKTLKEKNIAYSCEDNPEDILMLMCFQNPLSNECQSIKYLINSSTRISFSVNYFYSSILSVLIVLFKFA